MVMWPMTVTALVGLKFGQSPSREGRLRRVWLDYRRSLGKACFWLFQHTANRTFVKKQSCTLQAS